MSEGWQWRKAPQWHQDAGRSAGFARAPREHEVTVDNHPMLAGFHRW
ncbi:hypothetical protein [Streptomyces hokutonensis]